MNLNREYNITLQLDGSLTTTDRFLLKQGIMEALAQSTYTGDYQVDIPKADEI